MKKNLAIITAFFLLCNTAAFSQIRSNRDLIGKWQGPDLQLSFFSDYKVIMIVPGGKLPIATYTADFMKIPVEIKLTVTDNGQKLTYNGSLEFIDSDQIRLQYFSGDDKKNIFEKGKTVVLSRVK